MNFTRGESRWIIGFRSLLLLGLAALFPVYVFYTVVLTPTIDPIYTREYKVDDRITYQQATFPTAVSNPAAPVENAAILSVSRRILNDLCPAQLAHLGAPYSGLPHRRT